MVSTTNKKELYLGSFYLTIFLLLIISGIVCKRVYHHPEFMMLFHGPAAVFLVLGGMRISSQQRARYFQLPPSAQTKEIL